MTHEEAVNDLNVIKEFFEQESGAYPVSLEYAIEVLKNEPSADRPQGEWVDNGDRYFRCSLCGTKDTDKWHWCHGCGARMKGADDEYR